MFICIYNTQYNVKNNNNNTYYGNTTEKYK